MARGRDGALFLRRASDAFGAGAVAIAPILIGVVPFGMTAGVVSVENGLTPGQAALFALVAFAVASQIAAVELLGAGAPLLVVAGTAVVINLRMLIYSASLARLLPPDRGLRRLWASYLVTDHAYAVFVAHSDRLADDKDRRGFYLGAAIAMWLTIQLSTTLGAVLGAGPLGQLPLEFAAPLSFLGLLIPNLVDRPRWAAAVVAGTVATVAGGAPANLGMILGALAGIVTGVLVARRMRTADPAEVEEG